MSGLAKIIATPKSAPKPTSASRLKPIKCCFCKQHLCGLYNIGRHIYRMHIGACLDDYIESIKNNSLKKSTVESWLTCPPSVTLIHDEDSVTRKYYKCFGCEKLSDTVELAKKHASTCVPHHGEITKLLEHFSVSEPADISDTKPQKLSIPKVLRDRVWNRWIGESVVKIKCLCCEINEIRITQFHCGHVVAEACGGKTDIANLRPICASCNTSMGTENLYEFKDRCGYGRDLTPSSAKIAELLEKHKDLTFENTYKKCPGKEMCGDDTTLTHCGSCKNHHWKWKACPCADI